MMSGLFTKIETFPQIEIIYPTVKNENISGGTDIAAF